MQKAIILNKWEIINKISSNRFYNLFTCRKIIDEKPIQLELMQNYLPLNQEVFSLKIIDEKYLKNEEVVCDLLNVLENISKIEVQNAILPLEWGMEDNKLFIIEKYFQGVPLNKKLNENIKFNEEYVTNIIHQIAVILNNAHKNKLIHGMLTLDKIIIAEDNSLKIQDFSILSTIAHKLNIYSTLDCEYLTFIAPEVIVGESPTFLADIYSFGILLYFIFLKFLSKTSNSEAIKTLKNLHPIDMMIQKTKSDTPEFLETLNSYPYQIKSIILKTIKRLPTLRYSNFDEIFNELQEINKVSVEQVEFNNLNFKMNSDIIESADKKNISADKNESSNIQEPMKKKDKSQNYTFYLLLILAWSLLIFAGAFFVKFLPQFITNITTKAGEVIVPDVIEKSEVEAISILGNKGLRTKIEREYSDGIPEGFIIFQDPQPKMIVKKGRIVRIVVSKGSSLRIVPDVEGLEVKDAVETIHSNGLRTGEIKYIFNDSIPKGIVISQSPQPNIRVKPKIKIFLTVSKGKFTSIIVPDLTGKTLNTAKEELNNLNIKINEIVYQYSEDYEPDTIISQSILPNTEIEEGEGITLYVNKPITDVQEEKSEETVLANVKVKLPYSDEPQELVVIVIDRKGIREVYRKEHKGGETIIVPVEGFGKAMVKVFINGRLEREERL